MALAQNALTTVDEVKTYMGSTSSTDDTLIETLVNNVSDQIEKWCDRVFVSQTVTEFLDARGTRTIGVSQTPIVNVDLVATGARNSITIDSSVSSDLVATVAIEETQARLYRMQSDGTQTTVTLAFSSYPTTALLAAQINSTTGYNATGSFNAPCYSLHRMGGRDTVETTAILTCASDAESDYRVDYSRGLIHLRDDNFPRFQGTNHNSHFPNSFQGIFVRYTGGYTTLPNALVQAAFVLIAQAYQGRDRDRSLASENIGDYSYTAFGPERWSDTVIDLLAPFRKIR